MDERLKELDMDDVGFSSQDALLRLQASCRELMRTVLSCNVGAASLQNAGQGGEAVSDHVTLLRLTTAPESRNILIVTVITAFCREKLKAREDLFKAITEYELRMV